MRDDEYCWADEQKWGGEQLKSQGLKYFLFYLMFDIP